MRIFGKHVSLVAVLLTLSPAYGDLRLGGRAKKTGEGLNLDAPNGQSSEGLAVLKTVFRGGRENSHRLQTGREDTNGDGGVDSVDHLNSEGNDIGLGLGIMDGGNDSKEEANSTLVSNEVSEGSVKHRGGGVRGQNNHEPTSKDVELSGTTLRGSSVSSSSSEDSSTARNDDITGEDITASTNFSAEGVYMEESLLGMVEIERNLGLRSSKNQLIQFNESSYVNPMNDKYAHIYDLYEMEDNLQFQEEETGNGKYKDHDKNKEKYAIEKSVIIKARSRTTPAHSETNEVYSLQGKPICGKNTKNPTSCKSKSEGSKEKKKDPSYVHSTTFEEIMEKFHEHLDREVAPVPHGHGRELRLRFPRPTITASEAGTLGDALGAVGGGGGLESGLDILASTVVSSLCSIGMWAAAGATMGMSIALAPIVCAASAFWSGLIFSSFSWIGDTTADDAWWTVEAANSNWAEGDSLNIAYHRGGSVDTDGLGWIDRGEVKSSREDLDARTVDAIEVYIDDVDDVCVKNMQFQLGREPSGTGVVEKISITAPIFASITGSNLRSNGSGGQMCLYFGDSEGAIGNFKFHWRSALVCHKNFGGYLTPDYANCLSWAMYSYDKRVNGSYRRWTYSSSPSLPSSYSHPYQMVKNRGTNLCFDTENYKVNNFNPVNLVTCRDNDAQRFDFDGHGRIRSIIDPTKCIEAGSAGTLYRGLYIYDCHGGDWQRWSRWSDGRIRNLHHGKFIGMSWCRRASATRLELRWYEDGACGDAQKWA